MARPGPGLVCRRCTSWFLSRPFSPKLKQLTWRRSWAARGRGGAGLGQLGGDRRLKNSGDGVAQGAETHSAAVSASVPRTQALGPRSARGLFLSQAKVPAFQQERGAPPNSLWLPCSRSDGRSRGPELLVTAGLWTHVQLSTASGLPATGLRVPAEHGRTEAGSTDRQRLGSHRELLGMNRQEETHAVVKALKGLRGKEHLEAIFWMEGGHLQNISDSKMM